MSTTATTSTLAAAKRSREAVEEGGIARRKQRRTQRGASSAGTGSGGGTSSRSGAKSGGMAVYKDFAMPDLSLAGEDAVTIKVGREWMGRSNPKLKQRQLWGTDIYTDDSDIVAILVHTGYLSPPSAPSQISQQLMELRVTVSLQSKPPPQGFPSAVRHGLKSRSWTIGSNSSMIDTPGAMEIVRCEAVSVDGLAYVIDPVGSEIGNGSSIPSLVPAVVERAKATRSASASNSKHLKDKAQAVVIYNLCNEPWVKYSPIAVTDRGLHKKQWMSYRLLDDVLFLETKTCRYELSFNDESGSSQHKAAAKASVEPTDVNMEDDSKKDQSSKTKPQAEGAETKVTRDHDHTSLSLKATTYSWCKCKAILPLKAMKANCIPLPDDQKEYIQRDLKWEELQWAADGIYVRGEKYETIRLQFLPRRIQT